MYKYHDCTSNQDYTKCVLIKETSFNKQELVKYYGEALGDFIAYGIPYDGKKHDKTFIDNIIPVLESLGTKYIYIADANLFKQFVRERKAEPHLGYEFDKRGFKVTLGINYSSLLYNSANHEKMKLSLETFQRMVNGTLSTLGDGLIHRADFILDYSDMRKSLAKLLTCNTISCDIETTSLDFTKAKIVSIAFAINEHEGIALYINNSHQKLELLKKFFETYQGNIVWHNCQYDMKVLIRTLYMKHLGDTQGLLHGLEVMTKNFDDTKIMAYLALNNASRQSYRLKELCHSFAGNYAVEISNIDELTIDEILEYNLIDCLCTYHLYNKYPAENQELYQDLMKKTAKVLIQIEMTGMPIHMNEVFALRDELNHEYRELEEWLLSTDEIQSTMFNIHSKEMAKVNRKLKKKKKTIEMFSHITFNINSNQHVAELLYETMKLPVLGYTDKGFPAVDTKTLDKLKVRASDHQLDIINALRQLSAINKILTSFIPAFIENSHLTQNLYRLYGNFNIGGTVSGRLSSSNPNMQNIPSGSTYGKRIKQCFKANDEQIFCGADFNSLEDRINTLLTKDPNKESVYLHGFDGHSLRAYNYWKDQIDIPQAEENTKCFKIEVDNQVHYVTINDSIDGVPVKTILEKHNG